MKHTGCVHMDPGAVTDPHPPSGKTSSAQDYHGAIDTLADKVEAKVIEIRHDLHRNPELPNREVRTAKIITDHLKSLNFDEVRTGVGVHGVVGVLKGGQAGDKVVALRADFDALPVEELADVPFKSTVVDEDYPGGPFPVSHMCGHETHAAMLMGAAEVLAEMRDQIPGTVKFLFQGAEEGPPVGEDGGAAMMIKEGALENPKPDVAFAIHSAPFPVNTLYYCKGATMAASELVKIEINTRISAPARLNLPTTIIPVFRSPAVAFICSSAAKTPSGPRMDWNRLIRIGPSRSTTIHTTT
jgi:metal-dependent amidase/aminoacylase/carboxypeptidase family protein